MLRKVLYYTQVGKTGKLWGDSRKNFLRLAEMLTEKADNSTWKVIQALNRALAKVLMLRDTTSNQ